MSMEGEDLIVCGRLFHSLGPIAEKALSPLVFSFVGGMNSSDLSVDLSRREVE